MKTFLKLIAGALAFVASTLAFAEGGMVTSVEGSATVQTGAGPVRPLRLGDAVVEGDNLATGPNSTLVVRFDDGQVLALSSRAKLTVSTYKYNPTAKSGNILFSLVDGGMRTLTGLIGKASPEAVTYKARTATIGIRGTHVAGEIDGDNFNFGVLFGQAQLQQGPMSAIFFTGQGTSFLFTALTFSVQPIGQVKFTSGFATFIQRPLLGFGTSPQGAVQPGADPNNTTTTSSPNASGPTGTAGGGSASAR